MLVQTRLRNRNLRLRKFVEGRGGRRLGDRIAYVVRPELLDHHPADHGPWVEDPDFSETLALRTEPGVRAVLDLAWRTGIAFCIKG